MISSARAHARTPTPSPRLFLQHPAAPSLPPLFFCNILRMYGVGSPYGFGWAAKGFTGDSKPYVPASLKIQPCAPPRPPLFCCDILQPPPFPHCFFVTSCSYLREPDTRSGRKPEQLEGTLTVSELIQGQVCWL